MPILNEELCNITAMPHHLDVAVISYKFDELRQQGDNDHIIDLDPLVISELDFKRLFYYTHHNHNTFCVNKQYPAGKELKYNEYVSFGNQSVDNVLFSLSDEILDNIESDLGISRHMLSTCSLINLTKELNSLKTLRDFPNANVTCSLKWSDIVETLRSRFRDGDDEIEFNDGDDNYYAHVGEGQGTATYTDIDGNILSRRTQPGREVNPDTRGIIEFYYTTPEVLYQPAIPERPAVAHVAAVIDSVTGAVITPEILEVTYRAPVDEVPYKEAAEVVVPVSGVIRTVIPYEIDPRVPVILSISVQFITPNEGVSPTIVKFNYATTVDTTLSLKC